MCFSPIISCHLDPNVLLSSWLSYVAIEKLNIFSICISPSTLALRPNAARAMASSFFRFLDHTQRRTTVGKSPLDECSARRRDLHLTTHNRQTSMSPFGFEPTISADEQPQTYALDRATTGTGYVLLLITNILHLYFCCRYVFEIHNKIIFSNLRLTAATVLVEICCSHTLYTGNHVRSLALYCFLIPCKQDHFASFWKQ